jgi:hypothetical protein
LKNWAILLAILTVSNLYALDIPFFYETPRASALAGAFVAGSDDESAVSVNPACLPNVKKNSAYISGKVFNYDFRDNAGFTENYFNANTAAGVVYNNFGVQAVFIQGGDRLTVIPGQNLVDSAFLITGAFGYSFGNLNIGAAANVAAFGSEAMGITFDAGLFYEANKYLKTGLVVKNLINSGSWFLLDDFSNLRPTGNPVFVNAGICLEPADFLKINVEVNDIFENQDNYYPLNGEPTTDFSNGFSFKRTYLLSAEYTAAEKYVFRLGIKSGNDTASARSGEMLYAMRTTLTGGFGIILDFTKIDIAYENDFRIVNGTKDPGQYIAGISWNF